MNTETPLTQQLILVDFNGLQRDAHEVWFELGRERDLVGTYQLVDGALALFVEPGELEMLGFLRRRDSDQASPYQGDVYWQGVVDPASIIYHLHTLPPAFFAQMTTDRITLGATGTREGEYMAHAHHDGEHVIFTNGIWQVDGILHVETWADKQVWLGVPTWATKRLVPRR